MPTASDSMSVGVPASVAAKVVDRYASAAERSDDLDDLVDDVGDRMHAMSKCSPDDAAQLLEIVRDPQPLSGSAKATHEAGLARFASCFRIVE